MNSMFIKQNKFFVNKPFFSDLNLLLLNTQMKIE